MQQAQWPIEKVKSTVKKSMRESFPDMFGARWEEAAAHYQQSYRALHLESLNPLPGAEATLRFLRAQPLFLGIVSNKKGDTLRLELTHLGWEHYFDVAIGAGDAASDKPSCAPARLALREYRGPLDGSVWFVGDTAVDLECAANLGATAILYGDHTPVNMRHDGHGFAAHAVDHLALSQLFRQALA